MLPNVFAPYLIMLTAQLGTAILAEAALSYLGLGAAEPTPSWGLMLSGSALGLRREGALDRPVPRHRDQPGRLRLQPLRRLPARRARSEAAAEGLMRKRHGGKELR